MITDEKILAAVKLGLVICRKCGTYSDRCSYPYTCPQCNEYNCSPVTAEHIAPTVERIIIGGFPLVTEIENNEQIQSLEDEGHPDTIVE